jgi:formamidopyrimidine-DNA glycosylase
MPELPEVQTVLDGLSLALKDREILGLEGYYPGTLIVDPQLPDGGFPSKWMQAVRRGKYMILNLDSGISLIIHLRMTGKLVYEARPEDIHKHERARILLGGGDAIRFIDPPNWGRNRSQWNITRAISILPSITAPRPSRICSWIKLW